LQADLSTVFDGLNVLGHVPWSINTFVLDVAQQCWRDDIPLGDIPSRANYDVPPKPIKPDRNTDVQDSDAVKAAKAAYRSYREALTKHNRSNQKNMVRPVDSVNLCEYISPFAHQHVEPATGLAIPPMFSNPET
jgi:DNA-directed RNA polymerase